MACTAEDCEELVDGVGCMKGHMVRLWLTLLGWNCSADGNDSAA